MQHSSFLVAQTVDVVTATFLSSDAATGKQATSIDCCVDSAVAQEKSSSWTTASNTCPRAVYWLPTVFIRVSKVSLSWPATFVNFAASAPTTKCHCGVNSRRATQHMVLRRLLRGGATLNLPQTPKASPQFLAAGIFARKLHRPLRPWAVATLPERTPLATTLPTDYQSLVNLLCMILLEHL